MVFLIASLPLRSLGGENLRSISINLPKVNEFEGIGIAFDDMLTLYCGFNTYNNDYCAVKVSKLCHTK